MRTLTSGNCTIHEETPAEEERDGERYCTWCLRFLDGLFALTEGGLSADDAIEIMMDLAQDEDSEREG